MLDNKAHQEDDVELNKMNIKQFIEAARQYLFGFAPHQLKLATIAIRRER